MDSLYIIIAPLYRFSTHVYSLISTSLACPDGVATSQIPARIKLCLCVWPPTQTRAALGVFKRYLTCNLQ